MTAAFRRRLLSILQSHSQIQNHILGVKLVKSAPKIFTPLDSGPATACRCELGARLPASGLPSFPRSSSLPLLSSSSSSPSSSLIPRVPSSRVLHTTAKMSNEIVHPTIKDGWFREISNMWPGQAMTLKVEKVLHHEKSKYQDVLIFKSTDYGNVLVLDNVIQATERDEFSYQEMITHLAMNSHPNPKKVLVIGGGDGGVLREVVKHDCVEEAILCDIDEAVIRLSKQFLPHMSVGFDHPKSKTHVGDGFKFLDDYKNTFDVIITDSSDPEGPAESLFQKPYFQLLHDALREGGVITTQAENQWLHLPLITQLKKDCKEIFPVAEYAYTTIPTYPSGQIGFMVCCKDANRNVRVPLRSWTPEEEEQKCRYYNAEIHKASFILPTFAKKALE
ncbi:putrescine aminopropyltransferase [Trichoderma asperellum]|nr:putrescine aminopropyltransferase [Trichoderma asperellum]